MIRLVLAVLLVTTTIAGTPGSARPALLFFDDFRNDVSEDAPAPRLGVTELAHWDVLPGSGPLDVILCEARRLCVTPAEAEAPVHIQTKTVFPLVEGKTYQLSFFLPGGVAEAITITVGAFLSRVLRDFSLPVFITQTFRIEPLIIVNAVNALSVITHTAPIAVQMDSGPAGGAQLAQVALRRVPEPSTLALIVAALVGLAVVRLARRAG